MNISTIRSRGERLYGGVKLFTLIMYSCRFKLIWYWGKQQIIVMYLIGIESLQLILNLVTKFVYFLK